MKIRLLCLLLALLLCLGMVFVSCNDDTDDTPDDTPATEDDGGKKGDIEVEGAAQDATVTVPGQKVDGFSKPE